MRRFESISDELRKRNVELVVLSKDSVRTSAKHKRRDGLTCEVLSDPKLVVIRQFGLEHRGAVEFSGMTLTVAGVTLGLIPKIKTMAIPTSILCDEGGVIRWIDQAEDYRLRSLEGRVLAAIDDVFTDVAI